MPFTALSEYIRLLAHRKQRLKSSHLSLHADLLNKRHTSGELESVLPMEPFMEADYFLYLRAQLQPEQTSQWITWRPWSSLYLQQPPRFLLEATSAKYAKHLLHPLGVADIPTLRQRFAERAHKLAELWREGLWDLQYPLAGFDPETIGSR